MASNVLSRPVMPVPPVVMTTCAPTACRRTASRTAAGSSRTIWRPTSTWPASSSAATIASPLASFASVRVSLIVSTKQRTLARAALRCSGTDIRRLYEVNPANFQLIALSRCDHALITQEEGRRESPLLLCDSVIRPASATV